MLVRTFLVALVTAAVISCGDDGDQRAPSLTPVTEGQALAVDGSVTLAAADPDDGPAGIATGDFNGDGEVDVAIGAAFADGPDNELEDAGEVLVFLGPFTTGERRDAGADEHDAVIYGASADDEAGRAVASGDVNGDGIDDIVIGVPFGDGAGDLLLEAGDVAVVLGSRELGGTHSAVDLSDEADMYIYGAEFTSFAGFSLATGNINGDEFADIVIGSFHETGRTDLMTEVGAVHVVYSSADPPFEIDLTREPADATVRGPGTHAWLGEYLTTGDVDGDGLDDLVLSATFAFAADEEEQPGSVFVVLSPPPAELDLSLEPADHVIHGADTGDQIGHSSATGDVDGDGRDDLLLGAVSADGEDNAQRLAGEAALVLGASLQAEVDVGAGQADSVIYGLQPEDRLGRSVAIGDLDGDGFADLVLGVPGAESLLPAMSDTGALYVVPGGAEWPPVVDLRESGRAYQGQTEGAELANSVQGRPSIATADLDGDGGDELIVASPRTGEILIVFVSEL